MTTAIVAGSLGAVARQNNVSLAESFLSADVIILVDASGSMDTRDSREGRTRWAVANEELQRLQADLAGRIAVVGFSNQPEFAPGGLPTFQGAGTDLTSALQFVQPADGTVKFIVISDGQPNDEAGCLRLARQFESEISTIYVGPEGGYGQEFLRKLATAAGGKSTTTEGARELAQHVRLMLAG